MNLAITVIRSRRRTLALEIRPDCTVIIRAPLSCTDAEIRRFVSLKESWILNHLEKMRSETGLSGRDSAALCEVRSPGGGPLRQGHHPEPEDPLGQLQRRREPEFQLSADDGSARSQGLRRGTRTVPQKRAEPLRPFLGGGGTHPA